MRRQNISKTLRWSVFQRDRFQCQYCGREAPDVVLEVDHKMPLSLGGAHAMHNFITACFDCNRGKGARFAMTAEEIHNFEVIEERMESDIAIALDPDPYLRAIYGEIVV